MKHKFLFVYEWSIIVAALVWVFATVPEHISSIHSIAFLSLLTLTIGAELILIPLSTDTYTTLTSSVTIGMIMVLGPDIAAITTVIASLIEPILQRKEYRRAYLFNAANYAFCIYISSFVTGYLLHTSFPFHNVQFSFEFTAILLTMFVYHIVNHVLLDFLFFVRDGTKDLKRFWNIFLFDGVHHFLGAPLAIIIVLMQDHEKYIVLALVPLAMMAQLLRLNRNLTAMQKVEQFASQLNSEFDFDSIASQALRYITKQSEASNAAFLFMDPTGTKLITRYVDDPTLEDFKDQYDFESEDDRGIIYAVVNTKNPENIDHVSKDNRAKYEGDTPSYESMMVIPLMARNEVIGICICYGKRTFAFSKETFQLISAFAMQVGVILENARLYSDLQEMVSRDGTTGLYNYRHFYKELNRRFVRAKEQQLPFTVAVLDIDYFKQYNDMYGHLIGDEVIRQVGTILSLEVGKKGLVARYGGEEFAILLDLDTQASYLCIEGIRERIVSHQFEHQGYRVGGITISSGIASYPEHDTIEKHLLEKADQALYWGAKQRGRNKTAIYSKEYDKQLYVDGVTQLYTIHYLAMCLSQEIRLKHDTSSFAVICIKCIGVEGIIQAVDTTTSEVNLVQQVASLIRGSVRQGEIACRYGQSEFVLFVPGIERIEAEKIAERILRKITEQTIRNQKVVAKVRARAALLLYPDDIASTDDVLENIHRLFERMHQEDVTIFGQEQSLS